MAAAQAATRRAVEAIERETSHLPDQASRINQQLGAVAQGLMAVDGHLERTEAALKAQER